MSEPLLQSCVLVLEARASLNQTLSLPLDSDASCLKRVDVVPQAKFFANDHVHVVLHALRLALNTRQSLVQVLLSAPLLALVGLALLKSVI
eukprot:1544598-Rhodomonas_salina.1